MKSDDIMSAFASCTMREGATQPSLSDVVQWIGKALPSAYVELMTRSNGVEGFVGENNYFILWPVEQLKVLNEAYAVGEFVPGLLLIGSNGGECGYAFDIRHESMPVKEIPFIGMSHAEAKLVASSFEGFIEYLRVRG
jgi:hypothetical protein